MFVVDAKKVFTFQIFIKIIQIFRGSFYFIYFFNFQEYED